MIKAEIRTDAGNYVVSLENTETFQGGLSLVQTKLDEGLPFTGDNGYLLICNGSKLKHIRIFDVNDDVIPFMDDASDDVEQPPKGAYVFKTDRAEFLGHKLTVTGQALEVDGHTYYLPMEVNNNPALMTMGPEKLEEFLDYWLMSRQVDYDSYTVVIPAAQLPDYEEAREYVRDYAKETAGDYTPKERNARAWQEWKGIRKTRRPVAESLAEIARRMETQREENSKAARRGRKAPKNWEADKRRFYDK